MESNSADPSVATIGLDERLLVMLRSNNAANAMMLIAMKMFLKFHLEAGDAACVATQRSFSLSRSFPYNYETINRISVQKDAN
jgi:hypothetical protein